MNDTKLTPEVLAEWKKLLADRPSYVHPQKGTYRILVWQFSALIAAAEERDELRAAIQKHHDAHADDLCWLDDNALYEAAGLPQRDNSVGDPDAMLANCKRFIAQRCQAGGGWKSYAELESERDELRASEQHSISMLLDAGYSRESIGAYRSQCLRAEQAEAERDSLRKELEELKNAQQEFMELGSPLHEVLIKKLEAERDALRTRVTELEADAHTCPKCGENCIDCQCVAERVAGLEAEVARLRTMLARERGTIISVHGLDKTEDAE
jgi:hypothetical protein